MAWEVYFHPDFENEFGELGQRVKIDLLAQLHVLEQFGPYLGRPSVDTLKGAKNPNLKELRFRSGGSAWRFAFAFDARRRAIILCGGDKGGISSDRFYKDLVHRADDRLTRHSKMMEK